MALQEAVNDVREQVWALQDESFSDQAILDVDATIAETDGERKEGMGLSYKGIWGLRPVCLSHPKSDAIPSIVKFGCGSAAL